MNKAVIVSAICVMILPDLHVTYAIFLRLHNEGLFIHPAAFILLTQRKQTLDESGSREAVVGGGERQLGVSLPSPHPHRLKPPSKKKTADTMDLFRARRRVQTFRTKDPAGANPSELFLLPSLPPSTL